MEHGSVTGIILRHGYLIKEWGEPERVDMTGNAPFQWIDMATTLTSLRPTYGFMNWFLNTDGQLIPNPPATSYYHGGAGPIGFGSLQSMTWWWS